MPGCKQYEMPDYKTDEGAVAAVLIHEFLENCMNNAASAVERGMRAVKAALYNRLNNLPELKKRA